MVFSTDPRPKFVTTNVSPLAMMASTRLKQAFWGAVSQGTKLTNRERVAFALFNSAYFQPSSDSRFLTLISAIEALIEQESRSQAVIAAVERLKDLVAEAELTTDELTSLKGGLDNLRRESITQAGMRLVSSRLGTKMYGDDQAAAFFKRAYGVRSRLAHGSFPCSKEVSATLGPLELLVSDLLTVPHLPDGSLEWS